MLLNKDNLYHYSMLLYLISDFSRFSVDNLFVFFTTIRKCASFLTFVKTDCTLAYFLDFRQFFLVKFIITKTKLGRLSFLTSETRFDKQS